MCFEWDEWDNTKWKDKNYLYSNWKLLEWVDVNTFKFINIFYIKDKNNVYKNWNKQ